MLTYYPRIKTRPVLSWLFRSAMVLAVCLLFVPEPVSAASDVPILGANSKRTGVQPRPIPDKTPSLLWRVSANIPAMPIISDGIVYLLDVDALQAFELDSGTQVWSVPVNRGSSLYSTPTVSNGRIYLVDDAKCAGCGNLRLLAIDALTGEIAWSTQLGVGAFRVSPVVENDLVLVTGDEGTLLAYSTADGDLRWSYKQHWSSQTPNVQTSNVALEGGVGFLAQVELLLQLIYPTGNSFGRTIREVLG